MKKTKKSVKRKVHSIMRAIKKIQKMALNWYKGLFEEEKDKKKEYARNRYCNMFEEGRQNLICGMSQKALQ